MITRRSGDAISEGEGGRGGAIVGVSLGEDIPDMDAHRVFAEEEGVGDIAIRLPSGDEAQDLDLTGGEAGREGGWSVLDCRQAHGEGVGAGAGGFRTEWGTDRAHFIKQLSCLRRVPRGRTVLCHGEEGQRALERSSASVREGE